jgi:hypothetical protein
MATIFRRRAIVSVRELMCTVSFLPNSNGFYVAMNRDEKRTRSSALPPEIVDLANRRALLPSETGGGTWIATNDAGACFALINWHRIKRKPPGVIISRGRVVATLAGESSTQEIAVALATLPLRQMRPFRLIAIISTERKITEWRWNMSRLSVRKHPWRLQYWFSSGVDERRAEAERRHICNSAQDQSAAGTLRWLRRLHRSHLPKRGPFSICMHRGEAATVSYTEVEVSAERATMRYKSGPACSTGSTITKTLPTRARGRSRVEFGAMLR